MRMKLVIPVVVLTMLSVGCQQNSDADSEPITTSTSVAVFGLADVVESLGGAGATVEQGDQSPGTPFSAPRRMLAVEEFSIGVYEYADTTTRAADEATIAMNGWSVNATPVEWIAPPHYWSRGRVIVLYLGDDSTVISLLTAALGQPLDL